MAESPLPLSRREVLAALAAAGLSRFAAAVSRLAAAVLT